MIVHSNILGPLEIPDEEIVRFPTGLIGLPEHRSFAFLPAEREGLYWLQSVEQSAIAFVLVDPFLYFPGYEVDIEPAEVTDLGTADPSEVAILAIVTLPRSRAEQPTANLQGPLALSLKSRLGKQLALQDPNFGVRCQLDLLRAETA